jgi:hypothetical protein
VKNPLEKVMYRDRLIAIIIRSTYHREGIEFFTPDNFSQQLAYMQRPQGYKISPHIHNSVKREVFFTQEVLFLKKGKVKVDLFNDEKKLIESKMLLTGDVLLLAAGGHGLTMMEESEIIEVKQGPYLGENDKSHF